MPSPLKARRWKGLAFSTGGFREGSAKTTRSRGIPWSDRTGSESSCSTQNISASQRAHSFAFTRFTGPEIQLIQRSPARFVSGNNDFIAAGSAGEVATTQSGWKLSRVRRSAFRKTQGLSVAVFSRAQTCRHRDQFHSSQPCSRSEERSLWTANPRPGSGWGLKRSMISTRALPVATLNAPRR